MINTLFQDKVIQLRDLFIAMHSPQLRNDQHEFERVEAQYELLREEVEQLLKTYPELKTHPMANRIPSFHDQDYECL